MNEEEKKLKEIRNYWELRTPGNGDVMWLLSQLTEKDREIGRLRKLYEESGQRCNSNHINHLPVRLWDCPICVDQIRTDRDRQEARAERMKIKFMDIRSKAWNEMDNPTGMHMTCLSLIHKIAVAALEDER